MAKQCYFQAKIYTKLLITFKVVSLLFHRKEKSRILYFLQTSFITSFKIAFVWASFVLLIKYEIRYEDEEGIVGFESHQCPDLISLTLDFVGSSSGPRCTACNDPEQTGHNLFLHLIM